MYLPGDLILYRDLVPCSVPPRTEEWYYLILQNNIYDDYDDDPYKAYGYLVLNWNTGTIERIHMSPMLTEKL